MRIVVGERVCGFALFFKGAKKVRSDSDEFDTTADVPTSGENEVALCGACESALDELIRREEESEDGDDFEFLVVTKVRNHVPVPPLPGDESIKATQLARRVGKIAPPPKKALSRKENKKESVRKDVPLIPDGHVRVKKIAKALRRAAKR
jgi:hypothetical protein